MATAETDSSSFDNQEWQEFGSFRTNTDPLELDERLNFSSQDSVPKNSSSCFLNFPNEVSNTPTTAADEQINPLQVKAHLDETIKNCFRSCVQPIDIDNTEIKTDLINESQ